MRGCRGRLPGSERIEGKRVGGIRHIEVNQIGPPFFGHQPENVFREVAVGIEQREAFAVHEVLAREVGNQRGLAGPGLADDVHVGAAIGALDAEATMFVTEVDLGDGSDSTVKPRPFHKGILPGEAGTKKTGEVPWMEKAYLSL